MMKLKSKWVLAGIFSMMATSALAMGDFSHKHEKRFERMAEHLELSVDQKEAVRTIMENRKPQMKSLHKDIRALRKEIREVMQADVLDESKLRQLTQAVASKKADALIIRKQSRDEIKQHLSAEQQTKMAQFKKKMKRRHHERMQERMGW